MGAVSFVLKRLAGSAALLLVTSYVVYLLTVHSGDPLADLRLLPESERAARIAERADHLRLDSTATARYLAWLTGLLRGDLGVDRAGRDVAALLGSAMGATLQLILAAVVLAVITGVVLGVVSAVRRNSVFDRVTTVMSLVCYSLPVFCVAVVLKEFAAVRLNDWLRDPVISPPMIAVVAVLTGGVWAVLAGRGWRGRGVVFLGAAAMTAGVLSYLSAVRWFADPGIGLGVVAVVASAGAVSLSMLCCGARDRRALGAALVSAAAGVLAAVVVDPALADPTWLVLGGFLGAVVAVGAGIGLVIGRLRHPGSVVTGVLAGALTAGLVFLDHFLRAFTAYADRVGGRPVATIGARTPNFNGGFWQLGWDALAHMALPVTAVMLVSAAFYSRYARATMLGVLGEEYVRAARAKGLPERDVLVKHVLRNALIPLVTITALDVGAVIGGSVVIETVFGWRGMGRLFIDGLLAVDPAPVMAFFLVAGGTVLVFTMIADICYALLDPRVTLAGARR